MMTGRSLLWRLIAIGVIQLALVFLSAVGLHFAPPMPAPALLAIALAVGLCIVGAGALAAARFVLRPIDHLARTTEAFGAGDLSARANLPRSDEIGRLAQSFDEMADRIQRLLLSERELLANVSHELRTPLARIRVAIDLASEGDADRVRASLADVATDLAELEDIIEDILVALRFERAGIPSTGLPMSTLQDLAPAAVAQRAAERFRSRHPERTLDVAIDEGLSQIFVDPTLFRRVLDNLLENAHKYSPDRSRPIGFWVGARGQDIVFEISDHGIGIRAEDLPHVFEPFFRGERSRSRETGGVGLGLTLAMRIVEAHGGRIRMDSEPKVGTKVTVSLSARRFDVTASPPKRPA